MSTLTFRIPLSFARSLVDLSWQDIRFARDKDLMGGHAVSEFAAERIRAGDTSSSCLELAGADEGSSFGVQLERLIAREAVTSAEELQSKWLYVVLAWVYSTRAQLRDPLQVVEQIYDDWGYPEDVAGLVRYMPSDGPVSAAPAERDRTLIAHWKRYLDAAARRYAPVEAVP